MRTPGSEGSGDGRTDAPAESATLHRLVADLKRSNDDLEQFAYVVSHDLREPLRMVTCYARLLERRCAGQLDGEALEFLRYVTDGAHRMERLIDDILQFARAGRGESEFETFDSAEAVQTVMEDLRTAIDESGALVAIGPMPVISGHRGQVERVFENLLGNALKYRRPDIRPLIRVEGEETAEGWRFLVADNGKGIAAPDREKIFQVFVRLHGSELPGTGLGLAICRKLVERHGGRIWVEDAPDGGAAFVFTLARQAL